MTPTPHDLVRQFYAALDAQDFDVFDRMCTETFRSHFPGRAQPQSRAERKERSREFYLAFADLRHEVEAVIAEGAVAAARLTVTGTHAGPFVGQPPTGRAIHFDAMRFYRLEGSLLAEEWVTYDSLGLWLQIGGT